MRDPVKLRDAFRHAVVSGVITLEFGEPVVIVLAEGASGSNDWFFDISRLKTMSREDFVKEIRAGRYPTYGIRTVSGRE